MPYSATPVRDEGPDSLGVGGVELKEAEPNARDGQVLADLLERQWLDLTETCCATEPVRDHVAWLGLVSGDFADDGDRSQRLTVRISGPRRVDENAVPRPHPGQGWPLAVVGHHEAAVYAAPRMIARGDDHPVPSSRHQRNLMHSTDTGFVRSAARVGAAPVRDPDTAMRHARTRHDQ